VVSSGSQPDGALSTAACTAAPVAASASAGGGVVVGTSVTMTSVVTGALVSVVADPLSLHAATSSAALHTAMIVRFI
jgi:hypothetical protein